MATKGHPVTWLTTLAPAPPAAVAAAAITRPGATLEARKTAMVEVVPGGVGVARTAAQSLGMRSVAELVAGSGFFSVGREGGSLAEQAFGAGREGVGS